MKKLINLMPAAALSLSLSVHATNKLAIEDAITAMEPKQLTGVLVSHRGELVFESYYNGATADQIQNIRSASKTITGLMFGRAIDDGYFESDQQPVLASFPEYNNLLYPSDEKSAMTFFDLLTMTNPLECDDMNNFSAGHEERMYLRKDWIEFFLNLPVRGNAPWEPKFTELPFGRDFAYCTAGISITAAAIERASKQSFADYTQAALFDPLGIDGVTWPYSAMGITQGGGGLSIKPKDLLKLGQLVLQQGRWQGEQLIPSEWIAKSLQHYSVAMPDMAATYGITWWHFPYEVNDKKVGAFAAAGNGGNYLIVVPDLEITAVITATAYNTPYMHQQSQGIFSKVILPALID